MVDERIVGADRGTCVRNSQVVDSVGKDDDALEETKSVKVDVVCSGSPSIPMSMEMKRPIDRGGGRNLVSTSIALSRSVQQRTWICELSKQGPSRFVIQAEELLPRAAKEPLPNRVHPCAFPRAIFENTKMRSRDGAERGWAMTGEEGRTTGV